MFAAGYKGGGSDLFFGTDNGLIPDYEYYAQNSGSKPTVDWLKNLPGNSEGWGNLPTDIKASNGEAQPSPISPDGSVDGGILGGLAGMLSPETLMALQGLGGQTQATTQSQPLQPTMPTGTWGNW